MTETAHAQFAEELTNVHGLVCGDDDDGSGICELMEGWKYVAAEYDHLLQPSILLHGDASKRSMISLFGNSHA